MGADRLVGRRVGGFEIVDVLGSGAFATVYRARQLRLGRDVALKVLDPTLARAPDAARRFEREGWAAAGLDHPAIVPVYEAGQEDDLWYLAMRLIDGVSLAQHLATRLPLTIGETVTLLAPIATGLDHAHERDLLHRDVKPANILLEGDRVWLTDFGIAATTQAVGSYTVGAIGTAAYMAPEQAQPEGAQPASDLYALGCVAFECITGGVPFAAPDLVALLYAQRHAPIPTTGDPGLDGFFATALAKEPGDRFASGDEFIAALSSLAEPDAPVRVVPAAEPRRRRVPLPLAAAIIGLVVALAGITSRLLADDAGAQRTTSVTGPMAVVDPDGARYPLPRGRRASIERRGADNVTTILEGTSPAVVIETFVGVSQTLAAAAAAQATFGCATAQQQAITFGGSSGLRCEVAQPGGDPLTVYYASAGGRLWRVRLQPHLPTAARNEFLNGFQLPR